MVELHREHAATGDAWTICRWHECPHGAPFCLPLHDAVTAAEWLRDFPADDLRRAATELLEIDAPSRSTVAGLVEQLAALIAAGELLVIPGRPDGLYRPQRTEPTPEQKLLRRLRTTSHLFHFGSERLRIVDAREWALLRGSDDGERYRVVPHDEAEGLLTLLATSSMLPHDEAQAVHAAIALLPPQWHPAHPGRGILLVRVVERLWNIEAGGSEALTPSQLDSPAKDIEDHWIQIVLLDDDDRPVPNQPYRIELPTGEIREGLLDADGQAHIGGMPAGGQCKVCFPQIDTQEWRAA